MNWFERHLNYTVLLSWLAIYPLLIVFVAFGAFVLEPYILEEPIPDAFLSLFLIIFGLALPLFVSGWALRRKNRRLWWLLILFVPYVGGIIFLCLKNNSQNLTSTVMQELPDKEKALECS